MRSDVVWTSGSMLSVRALSPSIRLFEIVPDGGAASWSPGSHLDVSVMIDGRAEVRSYSLVGEPDGKAYRIAVKCDPQGRGGSQAMHRLVPGARISLSSPKNHFELEFDRPDYLLVAGGIGITPMLGMAQALKKRGARFRFVYCARSRDELALLPELSGVCGAALSVLVSDESQRLDFAREIAQLAADGQLYLCGPMRMLDAARREWEKAGRKAQNLRYETFGSSGRYATQAFTVRTWPEGVDVLVPENKSMLDALTEAGIDVMYDCKRGECGLCALNVLEATAPIDHRDVFFSEHERAAGKKICACVSRAAGGVVTVDTAYRGKAAA
jgi:ferredoxin-NADP reductase